MSYLDTPCYINHLFTHLPHQCTWSRHAMANYADHKLPAWVWTAQLIWIPSSLINHRHSLRPSQLKTTPWSMTFVLNCATATLITMMMMTSPTSACLCHHLKPSAQPPQNANSMWDIPTSRRRLDSILSGQLVKLCTSVSRTNASPSLTVSIFSNYTKISQTSDSPINRLALVCRSLTLHVQVYLSGYINNSE